MNTLPKTCVKGPGFTLAELMIVIGIISILTSIAIPGYFRFMDRARLKAAGRSIFTDLQETRFNALGGRRPWAIQFDTTADTYCIIKNKGRDGKWNTADDGIYKSVDISDLGVMYGSGHGKRPGATSDRLDVTYPGKRVIFNPIGTSKSGTVYLTNSRGDTFAVGSVSTDGRIRTWYNHGSGWK